MQTDIKDIKTYDASEVSDEVLKDDFRIACAWACRLIEGKSLIHSLDEVKRLGKLITKEFNKRGIETHPDKMKPCSRKFLESLGSKLSATNDESGIYITAPHSELIFKKDKSLIVKAKRFALKDKSYTLCDNKFAYGTIEFPNKPEKINLATFKKFSDEHKITEAERKKWWPKHRTFYSYTFKFKPFENPKPISVKKGTQTFIKSVKYVDSLAPTSSSGVELGDEIFLDDVLSKFQSFYVRKPFIYLVGGLPNNGSTKGDIDIIIDAEPDRDRDLPIHFRIYRMLPKEWWHRLNIMYTDGKARGPYTNNVPLFNMLVERTDERSVVTMSAANDSEITFPATVHIIRK